MSSDSNGLKVCEKCGRLLPTILFNRKNYQNSCRYCCMRKDIKNRRRKTMIPLGFPRKGTTEIGIKGMIVEIIRQAYLDAPDDMGAQLWIENITDERKRVWDSVLLHLEG